MTVAILLIGNAGAGKSTLLKQLGGSSFESGCKFRGGFTKDIYEQWVDLNNQRVLLMDVPGIFEPDANQTEFNSKKLTEALRQPYDFKLYFVLEANCRGPKEEELLMMHHVNECVQQGNARATFRVIVNQIPDQEVYNLYDTNVARDNFESFFKDLTINGYRFNSIGIDKVLLIRFNEDASKQFSHELARDIASHKAGPIKVLRNLEFTNWMISVFKTLIQACIRSVIWRHTGVLV